MDSLISRQAAINTVKKHYRVDNDLLEVIVYELENLPSVQPEIVKCKDCKNFRRNIPCVGGFYDGCDKLLDEGNEMPVDENFYCGYAEMRTDDRF